MGTCVIKVVDRTNRKVGDILQREKNTELSVGQAAVIKNNWRKVNCILPRVGKLVLMT